MEKTTKITRPAAQHSTAQHSTAQHSTAQHSTAQHSTAQHSTAQHSTAQHSTAQHSTAQHSTAQHSTAQHSTAQHSTAQHSTAQHSTAQHSTAQHSTAHCKALLKNFWTLLLIPVLLLTIINCETDQTEINNLNQRIDALTIANNNLKAHISTITGTTTTITGDPIIVISGSPTTINALQNQLNQLQTQLSSLSGASAMTIAALQNQLSTLSGASAMTIAALQSRINALTLSGGASAEQIRTLQDDLDYLNTHLTFTFDLSSDINVGNRGGIWSDGNTFWISSNIFNNDMSFSHNKIVAFNARTTNGRKQRDSSKDFVSISGSNRITSIWSNGTILWTSIANAINVYAYDLRTKERVPREDILGVTDAVIGIWGNETTIYLLGTSNLNIAAYDLATKQEVESKEIRISETSIQYQAIYGKGQNIWISIANTNDLLAYDLASRSRVPSLDRSLSGNGFILGTWADNRTIWALTNLDELVGYDIETYRLR